MCLFSRGGVAQVGAGETEFLLCVVGHSSVWTWDCRVGTVWGCCEDSGFVCLSRRAYVVFINYSFHPSSLSTCCAPPTPPGGTCVRPRPTLPQAAEPGELGRKDRTRVHTCLCLRGQAGVREGTWGSRWGLQWGDERGWGEGRGRWPHGEGMAHVTSGLGGKSPRRSPAVAALWGEEGPPTHSAPAQGRVRQWEEPTGSGVLAACWS